MGGKCRTKFAFIQQRVETAKSRFHELFSRLIGLLGRLERIQSRKNSLGPRSSTELEFKSRLDKAKEKLVNPSSGILAKVLQLEVLLPTLSAKHSQHKKQMPSEPWACS